MPAIAPPLQSDPSGAAPGTAATPDVLAANADRCASDDFLLGACVLPADPDEIAGTDVRAASRAGAWQRCRDRWLRHRISRCRSRGRCSHRHAEIAQCLRIFRRLHEHQIKAAQHPANSGRTASIAVRLRGLMRPLMRRRERRVAAPPSENSATIPLSASTISAGQGHAAVRPPPRRNRTEINDRTDRESSWRASSKPVSVVVETTQGKSGWR